MDFAFPAIHSHQFQMNLSNNITVINKQSFLNILHCRDMFLQSDSAKKFCIIRYFSSKSLSGIILSQKLSGNRLRRLPFTRISLLNTTLLKLNINCACYTGSSVHIKQDTKEMRVLSRKEQQILTINTIHSDNLKDIGILICLYTGIRIGELCALRWDDISISEKTLTVHNTLQRVKSSEMGGGEKKTKIILSSPKGVSQSLCKPSN